MEQALPVCFKVSENLLAVRGSSREKFIFSLRIKGLRYVPTKRLCSFWLVLSCPAAKFSVLLLHTIHSLFCNPQCLYDDGDDAHLLRPPPNVFVETQPL